MVLEVDRLAGVEVDGQGRDEVAVEVVGDAGEGFLGGAGGKEAGRAMATTLAKRGCKARGKKN
ncbi:MAG: hypothetical protein WDO13_12560 [Verrucomicrobiota bacterium]